MFIVGIQTFGTQLRIEGKEKVMSTEVKIIAFHGIFKPLLCFCYAYA